MKAVFAAIIGLQMLFLVGQAAMYQGRLGRGETLYLRVVPVDPRSLFMGNYANLSYDVSQVRIDRFAVADRSRPERGGTVYVGLTKDRPAKLVRASLGKPADGGGLVWLKGRVVWVDGDWRPRGPEPGDTVSVEYGLERFYLSEHQGKRMDDLSRQLWDSKTPPVITAVASVGSNGAGMLKDVLVNGKSLR